MSIPAQASVGRSAVQGARWTALEGIVITALQLLEVAILARVLPPSAFGVMAIVMIVVTFARVGANLGLSQAIVQARDLAQEQVCALAWANLVLGLVTSVAVAVASPLVAQGFSEPLLTSLLPAAAVGFLLQGVGATYEALAQRALAFRVLAVTQMVAGGVGVGVAVVLAYALDAGVWALVVSHVAATAVRTLLLVASGTGAVRWRARPSLGRVKKEIRFGAFVAGDAALAFVSTRVDQLLVGMLLGATALGYYSMAVTLLVQPMQRLMPVVQRVGLAVFALVQHDRGRMARGYVTGLEMGAILVWPLMLGASATASALVAVALGPGWEVSAQIVGVLGWGIAIRALGMVGGTVVLAAGRSEWSFWWHVASATATAAVVWAVAAQGDVVAVGFAVSVMYAVVVVLHYGVLVRPVTGATVGSVVRALLVPGVAAVAMWLSVGEMVAALEGVRASVRLAVGVGVGVVVYVITALILGGRRLVDRVVVLTRREARQGAAV